jgi:hypothetical protein
LQDFLEDLNHQYIVGLYDEIQKNQKEQALLDSGKIEDKMAAVEADILNLSSELDFVLSESNAKTVISVEL